MAFFGGNLQRAADSKIACVAPVQMDDSWNSFFFHEQKGCNSETECSYYGISRRFTGVIRGRSRVQVEEGHHCTGTDPVFENFTKVKTSCQVTQFWEGWTPESPGSTSDLVSGAAETIKPGAFTPPAGAKLMKASNHQLIAWAFISSGRRTLGKGRKWSLYDRAVRKSVCRCYDSVYEARVGID